MKSYQSIYHRAKSFFVSPLGFPLSAILFIVLAVYIQSLAYGFFVFDDDFHLLSNQRIQNNVLSGLAWIWSHSMMPVTYTVWSLVGQLNNFTNPIPFRMLSIGLHIANCGILYVFLTNFFSYFWKDVRSQAAIQKAAFFGAVLFAVHPVHVENVVWVSATKDLLSTFFFLNALNYYWKDRNSSAAPSFEKTVVTFFLISLAALSKPTALATPLLLIVLDLIVFRYTIKRLALIYGVFVACCFLGFLNLKYLIPPSTIEFSPSWPWRFVVALNAFKVNFYKLIIPFNYYFDYGYSTIKIIKNAQLSNISIAIDLAFFVVLTGLAWAYLKRQHNKVFFLAFVFLLVLSIPSLGLIPFSFQTISTVADRFLYLPSIAVAILLGNIFLNYESLKKFTIGLYVVLFLVAGVAYHQVQYWENSITLLEYSLKQNPGSYYMRIALAQAYENDGQVEKADQLRATAHIYKEM
ncbi:MAG: hypothetical protein ACKOX6_14960 [Bdellovibrio sp.]